jgi:predicted ATPase/DNA-binding XRE family transcriptional regulator
MKAPSAFGECLRSFRINRGLSQQMLAERANISVAAICALERGRRQAPYRETLALIASALQLDGDARAELSEAALASRPRRIKVRPRPISPGSAIDHNLPWHLTSFHGRERELAELPEVLRVQRLLTLCGPPGVGKSRLATALALRCAERFVHGIRQADIIACDGEHAVVPAIASAVEAPSGSSEPAALQRISERIGDGHVLLILDNCERLIDPVARAAWFLLGKCRNLRIVATSREPLRISGEFTSRLEGLCGEPAQALLFDRASSALQEPGDPHAAELGALVCERLDGLPLAIEIAATRLHTIALRDLSERLVAPMRLLNCGPGLRASYHETLGASIDRSFEHLTDEERCVFFATTRFRGRFGLGDAVAACTGHGDAWTILGVLSSLVEKSIVQTDARRSEYWLLRTIRAYGRSAAPSAADACRHADSSPVCEPSVKASVS